MNCPNCKSTNTIKNGIVKNGAQRYKCHDCFKGFSVGGKKVVRKKILKELSILEKYQRKFEYYKLKVDLSKVLATKEKFKDYRYNKSLLLEIELVPVSCWMINIRSNVKESEWDRIRFVTGGIADFKCEICGERGTKHPTECHEVWEYNEQTNTQILLKFQSICPLCHQTKHIGFSSIIDTYDRAIQRFIKLNNLTEKSARNLIKESYHEFKIRSKKEWKLDISLLSIYNISIDKTN